MKETTKATKILLNRVYLFLEGIESIMQAFLGRCHEVNRFNIVIRRWHPAHWVGWVRCVCLGDIHGSAFYQKGRFFNSSHK